MNNNTPLFRPESLEAKRLAWLGRPTILQNIPTILMASVSIIMVFATMLFLVFGQYTRRVRVSGTILPIEGLTRIVAPGSGWVTEQLAKEGNRVQKGDTLYVIGLDSTTSVGNTQGAINELLRRKRDQILAQIDRRRSMDAKDKDSLESRKNDLERERNQIDFQIGLLESFVRTLKKYADNQRDLLSRGVSVSIEYESRMQAFMSQQSQLENLKRERIQLEARWQDTVNQVIGFDLRSASAIGDLQRQITDVEQQIAEGEARRELRTIAPRSGTITSVITQAGQTVSAGTPLLTILPDDAKLEAQLLAPNNAIGFLRKGARVLLRYEAFPYQKFGQYPGIVSVISRAALRQDEAELLVAGSSQSQTASALYRVTVTPERSSVLAYGRKEPLQAGMQVEAHILAETRPLYQWILEPLYGLRGAFITTRADQ